jgi:CBS domain-containing protein
MSLQMICSRDVHTIAGTEKVRKAAMRMLEHHVGTLVVSDRGQKPQGIVTDRDIVVRCIAKEFDPDDTPVSEIMTSPVQTVGVDAGIDEAIAQMAKTEVRRLVVTDAKGRMIGVLALDDLLTLVAHQATDVGRLLDSQVPV